jgi:hypothetical protein
MSVLMYDTADSRFEGGVPANAAAALCYWDRRFANRGAAHARFPKLEAEHRIVSLTCGADTRADGVDWEPGNVCPAIGAYITEAESNKVWRPVVYADLSDMKRLIPEMTGAIGPLANPGPERRVRILTAHPTGVEHICGPTTCGKLPWEADGTQYWWSSLHGNKVDYDISAVRDDFFRAPAPKPAPVAKTDPRHYERYSAVKESAAGNTVERELVKQYDQLRSHALRNRKQLGVLRSQIQAHLDLLVARVVSAPNPKEALTVDWREYRLQRLLQRKNGSVVND